MTKRSKSNRTLAWLTAAAMSGTVFQFNACDTEVRDTLLSGLESSSTGLVSAVISAYFQSLQDDGSSDGSSSLTTP